MNDELAELVRGLPPLLASHLVLALCALACGVVISLPLAIVASERPRFASTTLAIAGVIQTIPGLALLALMVPVLAKSHGLGVGLPAFGFAPAVIALTLYAILPIVRNAITGLRGVDSSVVEAARAMGMTEGQVLRQVTLPLAAPVIAAGIRTATVWTVGAATLATPVGQACLGNYIFAGLQTRNWTMLLTGVAAAAALAITLDALLGMTERALAGRDKRRVLVPIAALAALAIVVLFVLPSIGRAHAYGATTNVTAAKNVAAPVTEIRLGGKTFTEQYILIEVMRARLERASIQVSVVQSLGSTVAFDALDKGEVDAYVDYSGTIWTNLMRRNVGPPRWEILAEVEGWLAKEHHVRSMGSLGFENAYVLATRRDTSQKLSLRTLSDLHAHAPSLSMGADYEFLSRAEWTSVRNAYDLNFAHTASFDPTLLYDAVVQGRVDVISAFSSDGRIAAHDLVVLDDPAGALPPYDAMILLGSRVANDARVQCALAPLRGALRVDLVRQANAMVDRDVGKSSPATAAAWLLAQAHVRDDDCAGALPR